VLCIGSVLLIVGRVTEHAQLGSATETTEVEKRIWLALEIALRCWILISELDTRLLFVDAEDLDINFDINGSFSLTDSCVEI